MLFRLAAILGLLLTSFTTVAETTGANTLPVVASSENTQATPEELAQVATQLLIERKLDMAALIVAELLKQPAPPMQALFVAGKLAELRSDWNSVILFYRAMLERDPSVLRIRLDLARALLMNGDTEAAQHHFQRVLGEPGLPESVRANVLLFLDQIDRLTFSQTLSFEVLGDNNINQATASEVVIIGGRRFILSPTARKRSGKGLGLNWQGQYRFGDARQFSLRAVLQHQNYPSANQYNLTYLMAFAGWTKQWSPAHSLSFEAGGHASFYGGHNLFDGAAFRISDIYRTTSGWTFNPALESKQLRYPDYPLRNGWQQWLTVDMTKAMPSGLVWSTGASIGRNKTHDEIYNFISSGAKLGLSLELPLRVTASVMLNYLETRYAGRDPFFAERRREKKQSVEVGLIPLTLNMKGFAPRIVFGHIKNWSNIDLYQFQRTYGKLAFVRDF
ncbi:porin family protein [Mariprofundus sp. KV]|uniref:porin family protein n=1 Tax=Mariprofundus sp. KV TaxID=2608715 RepID=UPI0015A20540|nr:porin family protein [Mariprofundus sp. KV]NWF35275.1 DUF560 domain-containing protein [Mariprofundus sp. KV]